LTANWEETGWTALMYAALNGHVAVMHLLLATGKVDRETKDSKSVVDRYGPWVKAHGPGRAGFFHSA
jgi:ankyrin repeat protein